MCEHIDKPKEEINIFGNKDYGDSQTGNYIAM